MTFDPVTFFTLPAQTAMDTYIVIPVYFRGKNYDEPLIRYGPGHTVVREVGTVYRFSYQSLALSA